MVAKDTAGIAQLVERNLTKVVVGRVASPLDDRAVVAKDTAGIAQLVERNLAKVEAGRAASTVPATTAVEKRT